MATYCENHVLGHVVELAKNTEDGSVQIIPTDKGTCGHIGGCNTGNVNLFELKSEYVPSKEQKEEVEKAALEKKAEELEAAEQAEIESETTEVTETTSTSTSETTETPETEPIPA